LQWCKHYYKGWQLNAQRAIAREGISEAWVITYIQGCHRSGLKNKDNRERKSDKKEQKLLNEMYSIMKRILYQERSALAMLCPWRLLGTCPCSSCLSLFHL